MWYQKKMDNIAHIVMIFLNKNYETYNTNTVVALAQAETKFKLELQVGARLTDWYPSYDFDELFFFTSKKPAF